MVVVVPVEQTVVPLAARVYLPVRVGFMEAVAVAAVLATQVQRVA